MGRCAPGGADDNIFPSPLRPDFRKLRFQMIDDTKRSPCSNLLKENTLASLVPLLGNFVYLVRGCTLALELRPNPVARNQLAGKGGAKRGSRRHSSDDRGANECGTL